MFNFPHCTSCIPVGYSNYLDLSTPKEKRNFIRKIAKKRHRYSCSQGESTPGCCRFKSGHKSRPKRYCRPSSSCQESRSTGGQTARRRSGRRTSSPQRCSLFSGATWCSTYRVPPSSPLSAPHVERKTEVIVHIDELAIFSDSYSVEDAQQSPVNHKNEQPNRWRQISSERTKCPAQPTTPSWSSVIPKVNA